jgi:lipopolysaccharide export system permease protein
VVARAAGISAWQFISPALIAALLVGIFATAVYNPISAILQEESKRLEAQIFGSSGRSGLQATTIGVWVRQRDDDGQQAILYAVASAEQGLRLGGVTVYAFDTEGHFKQRIEATTALLKEGAWLMTGVRIYGEDAPRVDSDSYELKTSLTTTQVRESFATPEAVPFWDLPFYINSAERAGLAAAGYRLQYQKLLARPFLLCAMVLLAASVSLRFFRFGGVQKMVMGGLLAGFSLYVLSKVTDDLSKAEVMPVVAAAWLPVFVGGFAGLVALLYQEDG